MPEAILVTGGAGFIGSNFVNQWASNNPEDKILVLDKLTYASDPTQLDMLSRVELVKGDIQNKELVTHILDRFLVKKIFHFAAESHVDRSISGPAEFIQTNILGTFILLESARQVWAGDKTCRFLHVSTDEVFGALGKEGKFTETTPYNPSSPYSASKASSDHLVRSYHHTYGMNTVITNCSNNYGPRQHPEKLIPLAISKMIKNEAVPIYGTGQNVRDWLYVEDHCEALALAMDVATSGETYCIGGNDEWTNEALLSVLADEVDDKLNRKLGTSMMLFKHVEDRAGHDFRYAIDASKIKSDLQWKPKTSFSVGIAKTVDWYLNRLTK